MAADEATTQSSAKAAQTERADTDYTIFVAIDPKTGELTDKPSGAWQMVGTARAKRRHAAAEDVARKRGEGAADGVHLAVPSSHIKPFRLKKKVTVDYEVEEV